MQEDLARNELNGRIHKLILFYHAKHIYPNKSCAAFFVLEMLSQTINNAVNYQETHSYF